MKTDTLLKSDFIIGEKVGDVKEMDVSLLQNKVFRPKRFNIHRTLCYDKGVIGFIRKNKYDTLITGGDALNITVWILLLYCKLKHIKIVMWTHGFYGRESNNRIRIKKLFFSFADRLWVYGEYAKQLLVEHKIYSYDKIDVVYNSLDYETQLSLREKISSSLIYSDYFHNSAPVLIFLGRLSFRKKLNMILEAVNLLESHGMRLNVVFVGDGEARETLKSQVDSNRVWFYGSCFDENKLAELVFNADLCVSPGHIGLTAMHSMMFGCPVITHNDFKHQTPEFESIKAGVTGDFFEKDNVESLANSIKRWLDLHNGKRGEVRKNCYEEIDQKWNPNVQIKIMQESLDKLKSNNNE